MSKDDLLSSRADLCKYVWLLLVWFVYTESCGGSTWPFVMVYTLSVADNCPCSSDFTSVAKLNLFELGSKIRNTNLHGVERSHDLAVACRFYAVICTLHGTAFLLNDIHAVSGSRRERVTSEWITERGEGQEGWRHQQVTERKSDCLGA